MHPMSSRQNQTLHLDTTHTDVEDALHSSKSYDSGVDLAVTNSPSCRTRTRLHPYHTPPATGGLPFGARMEHESSFGAEELGISPDQWPDYIQLSTIAHPLRSSRDLSDTSSIDSSSTGSSGASKIHEPIPRKRFNTPKIRRPISYKDDSVADAVTDSESESDRPQPYKTLSPFRQPFSVNDGLQATPTKIWNVILPWLLDNFDQIVGERNTGAIDFIQHDRDTPTICITAANTSSVDRRPIDKKLAEITQMRFQVEIRRGITERTARRTSTRWPAVNLSYAKTPLCGSSIGIQGSCDLASFGGFLHIQFDQNGPWELFGLTSHHVLEERTRDTPTGKGVIDGKLNGKEFRIQQPARQHIEDDIYRLDRHLQVVNAMLHRLPERDQLRQQQLEKQKSILKANRKKIKGFLSDLNLGSVKFSSGYGTMRDRHQMDWALIGDIPSSRSEFGNILLGGSVSNLLYEPGAPITEIADPSLFEAAIELCGGELARRDQTPPEPLCRIHGCGAISGNQTGYLSGTQSVVRLGRYDSPSLEWSFAPCNSLGTQGDSGSWIFNDFGVCVGMIIGRNEEENLTYFTPMHCILEDIRVRTGARDVRLARFDLPRYLFTAGLRDSGIDVSSGRNSTVNSDEFHEEARSWVEKDQRPEYRTMRSNQDDIPPRVVSTVTVMANSREQLQADYRKAAEDAAAKSASKPLPMPPPGAPNMIHDLRSLKKYHRSVLPN